MRAVNPHLLTASSVVGDKVTNAEGESLGELKELVIDARSGRVAYAVLGFGGLLGLGEKFFAVPWEAFQISPDDDRLYLNVPRERLRGAPGFDKNHWPSAADREFQREVYTYYGYKPYWDSGDESGEASLRMGMASDTDRDETRADPDEELVTRAYSGADLSGGAGMAAAGAALSDVDPGDMETLKGTSYAAEYGTETGMRDPASARNSARAFEEADADAGIDDRPRDAGGSPARGYGRGGINAPEDIDNSMNPGSSVGADIAGSNKERPFGTDAGGGSEFDTPGEDFEAGRAGEMRGEACEPSGPESQSDKDDASTDPTRFEHKDTGWAGSRNAAGPSTGSTFAGGVGAGPGGSDLGARDIGPRGGGMFPSGSEYRSGSRVPDSTAGGDEPVDSEAPSRNRNRESGEEDKPAGGHCGRGGPGAAKAGFTPDADDEPAGFGIRNAEHQQGLNEDGPGDRRSSRSMTEREQRSLGEQAADEFNPGLSGSISDIDGTRSPGAGLSSRGITSYGAEIGGGRDFSTSAEGDVAYGNTGGAAEGSSTVPADTCAFEREDELPARGGAAPSTGNRDMSGASGISAADSTGGSAGMSAAEDLEMGSVDDLNTVGTNLGPEYPTDVTVTEDEDENQPTSIRPGTRRGSTAAGDIPATETDLSECDNRGTSGSTGSGRGHSSGSSPSEHHRGSRGDSAKDNS